MSILERFITLSATKRHGRVKRTIGLQDGQERPSGLESLETRQLLSVSLLPLGDSITQANAAHNSYRRPLWHAIQQAGYDVDFIGSHNDSWEDTPPPNPDFDTDHEGHASWTASDILNGRASDPTAGKLSDWLQDYTPDVVLIHLSTNDLKEADGPDTAPVIVGQIIDQLRADNPDVIILLAQIIPGRRSSVPDYEQRIVQINENFADLAADKNTAQSPVILVDQWTGFSIDQDTYDELHPDSSGEQKMADVWFAALEPILDEIALPEPGRITASVYRDLNGNGSRNSGEPGLSNWQVFLDHNDNGVRDDGEQQLFTDANGIADFLDLPPEQDYIVRAIPQDGETFTNPASGRSTTYISTGDQDDVNFGVAQQSGGGGGEEELGRITASVYRDTNQNGTRNSGESGLANWLVYLDQNDNGVRDTGEQQAFTNANGLVDFMDLPPNVQYIVRVVPEPDETFTSPSDGRGTTFITPGDWDDVNFGVAPMDDPGGDPDPGRITASVYRDLNENGSRNSGEPGLANWLVFLDHNDNGVIDGGEQQLFTDVNGIADFMDLPPDINYIIRVVPEDGETFTNPADGRQTTLITEGDQDDANFGVAPSVDGPANGSIAGAVYEDTNENGNRDNGEVVRSGWRVYIDANDNGQFDNGETDDFTNGSGQFVFENLTPNQTYIIRVASDDDQTLTEPGSGKYAVNLGDGQNVIDRDFGFAMPIDPSVDAHGDTLKESTDIGLLDVKQVIQGAIGDGDEDFIKVKIGRNGGVSINLDQLSRDVDFEILNKRGKVIGSSNNGGTRQEFKEMPFGRRGGLLFLRIFQPLGETRPTDYDLTLTPMTAAEAGPVGNTVDLGLLNDQSFMFNGDVGDYKPANDYTFQVAGRKSFVAIDMDNADDALVVQLLNKKGKVIQTATAGEAHRLTTALRRGNYIARVMGAYFDEEGYDLTVESITEAEYRGVGTSMDLGLINGTSQSFNGTVGDPLPHDEFIIKVNGRKTDVSMILDNTDSSVVLQLLNRRGKILDTASGTGARVLAKTLRRGTYVVRVSGVYENAQGYTLDVTA